MKKILKLKEHTKGQALVEFALILPILMVLILGMIEFGWILNGKITLTSAAREGARAAVVVETNDSGQALNAAQSAVTKSAESSSLTIGTISIGILDQSGGVTTVFKKGNTLVVTVTATIKPIVRLFFTTDVPLESQATMRIE